MLVWQDGGGLRRACDSLTELLELAGLGDRRRISLLGSGGKTRGLYSLGFWARAQGQRCLLGTTTHLLRPQEAGGLAVLTEPSPPRLRALFAAGALVLSARPRAGAKGGVNGDKLGAWSPEEQAQLQAEAEFCILEADGSARLPLKCPDLTYEPALRDDQDAVLLFLNPSALGTAGEASCHRWALYQAERGLSKPPGAAVEVADVLHFIGRYREAQRRLCPQALFRPVLSHAAEPGAQVGLETLATAYQRRYGEGLIIWDLPPTPAEEPRVPAEE